MTKKIMNRVKVVQADITKLEVGAIVNAANKSLLGGGGVDGAIHRAAGPRLLAECRLLDGCETGEAKITKGYNLPAKYVIHTVGPFWNGGKYKEDDKLASCYRNSLKLAVEHKIRTIAFPAISAGVYRFPFERAAKIALKTIAEFLERNDLPETVILSAFSERDYHIYLKIKNNFDGVNE